MTNITKIMLKSAREAEKELGFITSNGLRRHKSKPVGHEIKSIVFELKRSSIEPKKLK